MNLLKLVVRQPVTVSVGMILIMLAGVLSVQRIPVHLSIDASSQQGLILRAGMSADVKIDTGKENSVLGRWTLVAGNRDSGFGSG